MKVIFSEDCQKQVETIKRHIKDKSFLNLYINISLCVKSLSEVKSIDEVCFGKREHCKNSDDDHENSIDGRLKKIGEYDLSDLASRDIDKSNRLVYFSYKEQSVIISSIGHYGLSSDEHENYKNLDEEKKEFNKKVTDEYLLYLSNQSKTIVKSMLELVKDIKLSGETIQKYNDIVFNKDILPISFKTIEERLSYSFGVIKIVDKYFNEHPKENRNFPEVINELKDIYNVKSDEVKEIDDDIWKVLSNYASYDKKVKDNIISEKIKITVDNFFSKIIPNILKFQNTYIQIEHPVNSSIKNRKNYFYAKIKSDRALIDNISKFVKRCSKKIQSAEQKKSVCNYVLEMFNKNITDAYKTVICDNHVFIKSYNKNLLERINSDIEKFNNLSKDATKKIKKEKNENIFPKTFSFFEACKVLNLNGAGLSREEYHHYLKNEFGMSEKTKQQELVVINKESKANIKR